MNHRQEKYGKKKSSINKNNHHINENLKLSAYALRKKTLCESLVIDKTSKNYNLKLQCRKL